MSEEIRVKLMARDVLQKMIATVDASKNRVKLAPTMKITDDEGALYDVQFNLDEAPRVEFVKL